MKERTYVSFNLMFERAVRLEPPSDASVFQQLSFKVSLKHFLMKMHSSQADDSLKEKLTLTVETRTPSQMVA